VGRLGVRSRTQGSSASELSLWAETAVEEATSGPAWRFSSDSLWRSAQHIRRLHERDVKLGRAGVSRRHTREVRLMEVIMRRYHRPPPAPVAHVYMMLAGLALEGLAKGLIVARDPSRVTVSRSGGHVDLRWPGSGHLSAALVDQAAFVLTPVERRLIERLGIFVRWAGRYPVPRAIVELAPHPGETEPRASWSHGDFEAVSALRTRLRRALDDAVLERIRLDRNSQRPA